MLMVETLILVIIKNQDFDALKPNVAQSIFVGVYEIT
jgi:hypothetical protein